MDAQAHGITLDQNQRLMCSLLGPALLVHGGASVPASGVAVGLNEMAGEDERVSGRRVDTSNTSVFL